MCQLMFQKNTLIKTQTQQTLHRAEEDWDEVACVSLVTVTGG